MGAGRSVRRGGRRGPRKVPRRPSESVWAGIAALFPLLMVLVFVVWSLFNQNRRMQAERPDLDVVSPTDVAWDSTWPPLPPRKTQSVWSLSDLRATYAFAARRADLLQFVPCYCGCERGGHESNLRCYVRARVAGEPVWTDHAFT